jgi:putative transposase
VTDQGTPEGRGPLVKTVPTVHLADSSDTVALPGLPEEVRLALTDIAGAAREGCWR